MLTRIRFYSFRTIGLCFCALSVGLALLVFDASAQADQVAVSQPWNGQVTGEVLDPSISLASTFTPTVSGRVSTVSAWLWNLDSAAASITAEIRTANADGSPTTSVLGSTTITVPDPDAGILPDSGTFQAGPLLTAGTTYTLVLTSENNVSWVFSDAGEPSWWFGVSCDQCSSQWHSACCAQAFTLSVTDSAAALLSDLFDAVQGIGPGSSLADKVAAIQSSVATADTPDACDGLRAFVNEVRAQAGQKVPSATASSLIADAKQIQTALGCST